MSAAEELASLEGDGDRLRMSNAADVASAQAEVLAAESLLDRIVLLNEWAMASPRAILQLLRVVARGQARARLAGRRRCGEIEALSHPACSSSPDDGVALRRSLHRARVRRLFGCAVTRSDSWQAARGQQGGAGGVPERRYHHGVRALVSIGTCSMAIRMLAVARLRPTERMRGRGPSRTTWSDTTSRCLTISRTT